MSTDRPPLISCGTGELSILEFMSLNAKKPFNRRAFAKKFNLSPSTVYDRLLRLVAKEFVKKESTGVYVITEKGRNYALTQKEGGRIVSGGMSVRGNYSQHSNRFVCDISDRSKFVAGSLCKLGAYEELKMQNWSYLRLNNSDAVVTINPKQVVIYVEEIVSNNNEDAMRRTFDVAVKYVSDLRKLGLVLPSIRLEVSHYARMESVLSDLLVKRLGRYELTLKTGESFWVDFSGNKLEDETDSQLLRSRLDDFLNDLTESNSLLSDVDKLKQITSDLVRLKLLETFPARHPNQKPLENGGDYFG